MWRPHPHLIPSNTRLPPPPDHRISPTMADQQILSMLQDISSRLGRLELAVGSGGGGGGGGAAAAAAPSASGLSAEFAAFASGSGAAFVEATKALGKKAAKAGTSFNKMLEFNASIVARSDTCRAPTADELAKFGKTLSDLANDGLKAQLPDRNMEKGLVEIYNAMAALLHATPVQTVADAFEAMQFYTNKASRRLLQWVVRSRSRVAAPLRIALAGGWAVRPCVCCCGSCGCC